MTNYIITFGRGKEAVTLQEQGDALAIIRGLKSNGWETDKITRIHTILNVEGQAFAVTVSDASGWGYYATADEYYDGSNSIYTAHDFQTPERAVNALFEQLQDAIQEGRI